jgi:hypothetical protein
MQPALLREDQHGVLDTRLVPPVVGPVELRDPECPGILDDHLGTRAAHGGAKEHEVFDLNAVRWISSACSSSPI